LFINIICILLYFFHVHLFLPLKQEKFVDEDLYYTIKNIVHWRKFTSKIETFVYTVSHFNRRTWISRLISRI